MELWGVVGELDQEFEENGLSIWAGVERSGKSKVPKDKSPTSRAKNAREMGHPDLGQSTVEQGPRTLGHPVRVDERACEGLTAKQLGEIAEAQFLAKASGLGFGVAKPWGDSRPYDFILDAEGRLTRVQVKSAYRAGEQRNYSLRAHGRNYRAYTAKEIDALAGYVVPLDAWYLFPVRLLGKLKTVKLFPDSLKRRSKFERWREAWWVVRGKR